METRREKLWMAFGGLAMMASLYVLIVATKLVVWNLITFLSGG